MSNIRDLFSDTGTGSLGFSLRDSRYSEYFVIDGESRIITPPTDFKNFGVESDENTERVWFECPQIVGDDIDLTTYNLYVNFRNANGDVDKYLVEDVESDGELIHFSWVLSRKVTRYKGTVHFVVCAVKTDKYGEIINEWNTTLCSGDVLEGLEVESPTVDESTSDLADQLVSMVKSSMNEVAALKDKIGKLGEIEKGDGENSIQQRSNRATASNAAALNAYTRAAGINALSTGEQTVASGKNSNTEGYLTFAFGEQSHAQNCRTIAGIRGFDILSVEIYDSPYSLIYLDSVEGIENGDTVSLITQNGVMVNAAPINWVDTESASIEIATNVARGCILYVDEDGDAVQGQAVNTLFIARKPWLGTKIIGHHNHAEGFRTVATGDAQHVEGKCNIIDTKNEFAHIVGNGTGEAQRSNAYTLDWEGNAEFAGSITAKGAKINGAIESPTIDELYRKNDANKSEILNNIGLIESGQIIVSEEGQSINLKDASDMNMKGLNIFGKTNQAGSPSPENPSELSNIAPDGNVSLNLSGKNLIPYPYKQLDDGYGSGDFTITDNGDGTVTFNGTTNATRYVRLIWNTELFELPAGEYTLSGCPAGGGKNIYQIAVSKTVDNVRTVVGYERGAGFTFTHDGEGTIDIIISLYTGVTYNKLTFKPVLERGSAATDFEPYKVQSMTVSTPNELPGVPVSNGGNYTDADGQQWVCDEIDLERGVYIQRIGEYELELSAVEVQNGVTSPTWVAYTAGKNLPFKILPDGGLWEYGTHYNTPEDMGDTSLANAFCMINIDFETGESSGDVYSLLFNVESEGTEDEIKAVYNGSRMLLIRKEPIEISLPDEEISAYKELHTYKPLTNIFNDAGAHMAVEYIADPKTYIDNKFAKLEAAISSLGV